MCVILTHLTYIGKHVTFWYPSDPEQKKVFADLNLVIPPGKAVGICGRTGCGKSTLLRLLSRLYDVQGGQVGKLILGATLH